MDGWEGSGGERMTPEQIGGLIIAIIILTAFIVFVANLWRDFKPDPRCRECGNRGTHRFRIEHNDWCMTGAKMKDERKKLTEDARAYQEL